MNAMNQNAAKDRQQPSPLVVRQAIQWMLRLNNEAGNARLHQRCEQWRAVHVDHECAWQRVLSLNTDLNSRFKALPASSATFDALENSAQRLGRRRALKMLSGLLLVGSAGWVARDLAPWQQWNADFSTEVGKHSGYQLADGSRLRLNTDSEVNLDFTPHQRLLTLNRGELQLKCGNDEQSATPRPLLIGCRDGQFEGLSGRFVVRQNSDHTRISVIEGRVLIRSPGVSPMAVEAGQSYSVTPHRTTLLPPLAMEPGAWTDGLIVSKNVRLGDFLAEVSRYRHGYLDCADDIADLRLSGVFRLEDTDKLLEILPQTLPVRLRYRTRWWVSVQRNA